jgi:hypothetical protein
MITFLLQSVTDKFSPNDTVLPLSKASDLTESALSSACLLLGVRRASDWGGGTDFGSSSFVPFSSASSVISISRPISSAQTTPYFLCRKPPISPKAPYPPRVSFIPLRPFGEIGGFRQRKYGVVWAELIGYGLELDIASGWGLRVSPSYRFDLNHLFFKFSSTPPADGNHGRCRGLVMLEVVPVPTGVQWATALG